MRDENVYTKSGVDIGMLQKKEKGVMLDDMDMSPDYIEKALTVYSKVGYREKSEAGNGVQLMEQV